jgi:hypothetical protein
MYLMWRGKKVLIKYAENNIQGKISNAEYTGHN